jgi:SAM-dependent methyltransferase
MADTRDMQAFFSGRALYGDDFDADQIARWLADEKEAYADLFGRREGIEHYPYHQLNIQHGYRHLPERPFPRVLGLGSAAGAEFLPIAHRIGALRIVEPSDAYAPTEIAGVPVRYLKPTAGGELPFADGSFDLVTAFGALHHVPNVSRVVGELFRCTAPGGFALIREPIVSMGDWTRPRAGLTRRERGIPVALFRGIVREAGFEIRRETLCVFRPLQRLWKRLGRSAYDDAFATRLDQRLCALLAWNLRYHRTRWYQKLGPTSLTLVLARPGLAEPAGGNPGRLRSASPRCAPWWASAAGSR